MSETTVRSWMRREGVYDVEVEAILNKHGVEYTADFENITQPQWEDVYSESTAARTKLAKDQSARRRIEDKLRKIEKKWRSVSGVKKTAMTESSAGYSREEKVDEASNLRQYMKSKGYFDVDIFNALQTEGLTESEEIATLSRSEFRKIKREVKVAKRNGSKQSLSRIEKKLIKFEKDWRAQSGIKSTNMSGEHRRMTSGSNLLDSNASKRDVTEALSSTVEIKKYLQSNQCFDKDLLMALWSYEISSPDDFHKIKSEKQFNDIIRRTKVARFKDLKDPRSRSRLEAKLIRFEKLWRKQSAKGKTNHKKKRSRTANHSNQLQSSNASNTLETEAINRGYSLKKYLQNNQCFDKDLLILLVDEYQITGPDELNKITSYYEFEHMITKVKVSRFKQLKDSSSRTRLEKRLTKFEKLWAAKTGMRKSSMHNRNYSGMSAHAPKSRMEEYMDKRMSVTSTHSQSKSKTRLISHDSVDEEEGTEIGSSDGEGEELSDFLKDNNLDIRGLYDALVANGVRESNDLSLLYEIDIDKIVRELKNNFFKTNKNLNDRKSYDNSLTKFKNLWQDCKAESNF